MEHINRKKKNVCVCLGMGVGGLKTIHTNTNKPSAFVYLHSFLQAPQRREVTSKSKLCRVKQYVCVLKYSAVIFQLGLSHAVRGVSTRSDTEGYCRDEAR